MMTNKGFASNNLIVVLISLMLVLGAQICSAADVFEFANGITATVHSASEINNELTTVDKGRSYLVHPSASSVELQQGDRQWFPFDLNVVVSALEDMHGFTTNVDVEVFILPAPPANVGCSFARRGAIYLSPGFAPVDAGTASYITTHEMGHMLTWAFMDSHPARWEQYMQLRNLNAVDNGPDAIHADRAREILAEDIRFLFGGQLATASGSIENHLLVTPDRIDNLVETLDSFLSNRPGIQILATSSAFPNPCNPLTTIEMSLPAGSGANGHDAVLRVFDVRGSLVRTISGGYLANDRVSIQWNGTSDNGRSMASGQYLYVMQLGGLTAKGSVTLVR